MKTLFWQIIFPFIMSALTGMVIMLNNNPLYSIQWLAWPVAVVVFILIAGIVAKARHEPV